MPLFSGVNMMSKVEPYVLSLAAGDYYFCTCGKSKNLPYCDGSHKGSEFQPYQMQLSEPKTVAVCKCGYSGSQPFCDGSHKNLD